MKVDQKPTMIDQKKDVKERNKKCHACGKVITADDIRVAYKDDFYCFICFDKLHQQGKCK